MQNNATRPTRALIVFNPNAGQAGTLEQDIHTARDIWREHGWQVELQPTRGPGDGIRIAREAAAQHFDVVIAAGGDGTVNEVVNGLAGTQTALGALPIGTVNVWVRELGLPLQPRAAAEALLACQPRTIDLGRAGDRYFLLMCGVGFDAAVTAEVRSDEKRRLGMFAYLLRALNLATRFRGTLARIVVDGKLIRSRVLMVVLGNSQLYGGVVKVTSRASLDDGLLDLCIIKGRTLWSAPFRLLSILTQRYNLDPKLEYHRAREINIITRRPLPVQVDGDHIGETPMRFQAVPGALIALLPPSLPEDLVRPEVQPPRYAWRRLVGGLSRTHRPITQHKPSE
ncbi:MAG: diacylglycerol kinase family lipid kinase [Chloroflexi bacterium SZAS-1]|mgnify:CR=1 FL=1|jgi:YegS/Rv2252/BmrU family lipid kinase|nr:diacylglycerol kinase family lipid kinase [Chloroflexi bacterium SZAS-1]HNP86545.1 diacylglycerol kinase family lipid kinase [Kouleothrix sp.]